MKFKHIKEDFGELQPRWLFELLRWEKFIPSRTGQKVDFDLLDSTTFTSPLTVLSRAYKAKKYFTLTTLDTM